MPPFTSAYIPATAASQYNWHDGREVRIVRFVKQTYMTAQGISAS